MSQEATRYMRWLSALALILFSLKPFDAGTASAASPAHTAKYEMVFKGPWSEDSTNNGLQHLEHVNVCIPSHEPGKHLYYELLGLVPDVRRADNLKKGAGTIWANIGTSQIHLPTGEPQVIPGTIGLVYNSKDIADVMARLRTATSGDGKVAMDDPGSDHNALVGTKFGWRTVQGAEEEDVTLIEVTCPYGNVFRLHEQRSAVFDQEDQDLDTGAGVLDPRGGRLPSIPVDERTSSPSPLGLGMAYVSFRVRPGTAEGIARFYREIFSTEAEEIGGIGDGRDGEETCDTEGSSGNHACSVNIGMAKEAVVRVGPVQHLVFVEGEEALPEYDGHHICVYLSDEGFRRSFLEAERRGLVFVNPRRNFGKADTLEKALEEKQYRIKHLVDPATGEFLHELEHEIRSVSHPSYPVGRDLSEEMLMKM